jgi:elongation factor P
MYTASDLRKGLKVEIDGQPYLITEFTFVKPGKGQAVYTCKLKNMINGSTLTRAYRSDDRVGQPQLEEKKMRYSYADGDQYVFIDDDYAQVHISAETLGENRHFLVEDLPVQVLFHNGIPIDFTLPNFIEKKVIVTEPGARGNTATNVMKPATVEGGYQLPVPLFVLQGETIRIDTRTGEYADRVTKK